MAIIGAVLLGGAWLVGLNWLAERRHKPTENDTRIWDPDPAKRAAALDAAMAEWRAGRWR